ncbi:hypothetical protein RDABS01_004131 [Bienertia sinuspersici]
MGVLSNLGMLQSGKESQPDEESYDLVISMLFRQDQIDTALKYIDLALKSGYMLSTRVFVDCIQSCVSKQRLESLVMIIEKCKAMDQNKALSPNWSLCQNLAEVAILNDNSKLTFLALGFMARWIQLGENGRPPVYHSVDEGLVISALATAARTYDSTLLEASWAILKRSLREKRPPKPETYLAKINALASLGNLQSAFSTLSELERIHASSAAAEEDLLSPFTSLYSLGVKPNAMSYSLLVDAHLINRDPKAALSVLNAMVEAGFEPSKDTLKKVKRRCIREIDYDSSDQVSSLAKQCKIVLGTENRRNILFNLTYNTEYVS